MNDIFRDFRAVQISAFFRRWVLIAALIELSALAIQAQETLIPTGATWRWRKGTNEVSTPNTLWRGIGFNDSTWSSSNAPFHYGESLSGGTQLNDMQNGYTCVFLRTPLVVTNVSEISAVQFAVNYDDGFVAWINGTEVARSGVTNVAPAYNNNASISHEAATAETITVTNLPANYLVIGTNILAVQAFNVSLGGSADFRFETLLQVTKVNVSPPIITNISPSASATLGALSQITVSFSKPVSGVDATDLLINDQPADSVIGAAGTNRYTFSFTQPLPGLIGISWSDTTAITDLQGGPFDTTASGANWTYTLTDSVAPVIAQRAPVSSATVSALTQVELFFSEPVLGVTPSDLRINGSPAANVTGAEAGPYVFAFAQPAAGTVNFSWAGGHGITDFASNAFVGTNWSLTLNPTLAPGDIVINEFVAGNINGLADEDGEKQDWIELYNRGTNAVNLLGWSLTDAVNVPGLWTFPSKVLNPGEYLVVFASEKNRTAPIGANKFHTNFKLDLFGDYLALYNAEYPRGAVNEFTPQFPEQRNDYSYGRDTTNALRYFQTPTPGAANGSSTIVGVAPEPHFSVTRGLFEVPFNLLLTTAIPGATIRYTIDGSEPTLANGLTYSAPLQVTNTTIIRAAIFAANYLPSRTITHTYLYIDSALTQPSNPPGFPSNWGAHGSFTANGGLVPADYEMDLDPVRVDPNNSASAIDPDKLARLRAGLRELPIVSLVTASNDMFTPAGMYSYPNVVTKDLPDRPSSLEMILPDGSTAFAANAGVVIHGNASRDPLKNPKHGFGLKFSGDFGPTTLDYPLFPGSPATKFDDLILRADFGVSWRHWSDSSGNVNGAFQRTRAIRFREAWMKQSLRDMGQPAGYNAYCHLFINGLYWGLYDFTEQALGQYAENYLAASTNGYDICEQGLIKDNAGGNNVAYNAMLAISNLNNNTNYEAMKQYLNVPGFIDFTLLCFWGGAEDWGFNKNWYAVRPRIAGPQGVFNYTIWDGENYLMNETLNRVANSDVPSGLHTKLDDNAQYRLDFADHVHKHMIAPGGALTRESATARWNDWISLLDKPIVAESCRWGDYRRDVHPYQDGTYQLYTRENHWFAENQRITNSYFVNRPGIVLGQLRTAGLYPTMDAPEYRQSTTSGAIIGSSTVGAGYIVALNNPGGAGTIYYTTNGSDPRVYYSGVVAAGALTYSTPLTLNSTVTLKSRILNGTTWSALNEATFTVGELGVPLRITEIMYNPIGGDAYEFVEIQNVGALPLNIGGFSFQGITYIVPLNTILQPGATLLLANNANPAQFTTRYPSASVFGYFTGNLSNGGERIAILDGSGNTVIAVHYDDENGWPTSPDGGGYSLEILDPRGDPNAPANWRASSTANGTPGLPPVAPALGNVIINEVAADNATSVSNGGLFPDWIELRNTGGSATNIASWSLTDNSNARQFVFPANTIIAAGSHLVVWCDSATNDPGLHTLFSLAKNGETISLYNANTNRADAVTFGLQITDQTVGRIGSDWQLTTPTPTAANIAATLAPPTNIAINEWLADPTVGGQDWLELFNRSFTAPVALRGFYLGTSNSLTHYTALSFIAPRGYAQLFCEELPGADQLEFKLPASGGAIILSSATGVELERITYATQTASVSQGRLPDGAANTTTFPGSTSPGSTNYLLAYTGPGLNEILARNDRAIVSPWGNYADFVELYNASGSPVSLAGLGLGDSTDFSDTWKFPAGATIAAGGYVTIWCDNSRAASTSASGPHNTGFSLAGDSGAVYLFNAAGQPVDWITHGFQVEDLSIGRSGGTWRLLTTPTPGAANSAVATLGTASSLRFNEWMPAPLTGDDWFELYNTNTLPVDLSNLYLTDNPSSSGLTNSPIAPLSFIGGRKWVKFVADSNVENDGDHAGFNLDVLGETLRLYTTNLSLVEVMDFGVQADGVSQGRLPNGNSTIVSFPTTPTPNAANYLPLTNVVINEILTHTDPPLEDVVEFFNPTASAVSIGGWFISDSQSDLKRYRIPDGTTIPAGGFKVFYQNQFGPADGETDALPLFTFNSAHGDAVYLSQADASTNLTGYRIGESFDAAANGVSFGRYQTSVGTDFVPLSQRSFGVDSPATLAQFRAGTGAANTYPLVGPVVISELMYHPPDFGTNSPDGEEFIELLNVSGAPVPLYDPAHTTNVWRLAGGVSFSFATNQALAAGARLVVVGFNPTNTTLLNSFRARYGTNNLIVGPYSGHLDNAGESVELWRPDAPQTFPHPDAGFVPQLLVERVTYADAPPWPTNADGSGSSLQRITATSYGNDPVNWQAASPTAGQALGPADTDGDGLPDVWEDANGTNRLVADANDDDDLDGQTNWQEFLAGTHPNNSSSNLKFTNVTPLPAGVALEFLAVSNHTYTVLASPTVSPAVWSKLADVGAHNTNRVVTHLDLFGTNAGRLYRLITPAQP